jgi:hypothetical protein
MLYTAVGAATLLIILGAVKVKVPSPTVTKGVLRSNIFDMRFLKGLDGYNRSEMAIIGTDKVGTILALIFYYSCIRL